MYLNPVGIIKYAHALAPFTVITMHHSIYDGLSQYLKRILRYIDALKALDPCPYSDIPAEECFSTIYQFLKGSRNNSAISISTRSNRLTEQNTCNVALYKVILRTIAEKQKSRIGRHHIAFTRLNSALQPNQYSFYILVTAGLTILRALLQINFDFIQVDIFHCRVSSRLVFPIH